MRIAILIELGRGDELIDVRVPNRQLGKKEADEYLLRSNKNTGEWDIDILGKSFNFDFLKEIGFTDFGSLEFQRYNKTERLILYFKLHLVILNRKEISMRTGIPKYQIERFVKAIMTYGYETDSHYRVGVTD
jgi:hypothetical protein